MGKAALHRSGRLPAFPAQCARLAFAVLLRLFGRRSVFRRCGLPHRRRLRLLCCLSVADRPALQCRSCPLRRLPNGDSKKAARPSKGRNLSARWVFLVPCCLRRRSLFRRNAAFVSAFCFLRGCGCFLRFLPFYAQRKGAGFSRQPFKPERSGHRLRRTLPLRFPPLLLRPCTRPHCSGKDGGSFADSFRLTLQGCGGLLPFRRLLCRLAFRCRRVKIFVPGDYRRFPRLRRFCSPRPVCGFNFLCPFRCGDGALRRLRSAGVLEPS